MDTIVNVIFPVLVVIIGGACTLLLISTKTLRDSRDDQEKRIVFLESQHERDVETIRSQGEEIRVWSKTVTGEVHLVAITDLLSHHHDQAVQIWNQWEGRFEHLEELLGHQDALLARVVTLLESHRSGPTEGQAP